MFMRLLYLFFIFTFTFSLYSQSESKEVKLSRAQREQLKHYQQISELVRKGKTDQKKFFLVYYKPVYEANLPLIEKHRSEAKKLNERMDKALLDNKQALAQRLGIGAKLYTELSQVNKGICDAYERESVGNMRRQLDLYLELEAKMKELGIKPYQREWFTTKEAERLLKSLARQKK